MDNTDLDESIYNSIDGLGLDELIFGGYKGTIISSKQTFGINETYYTLFDIFGFRGPVERVSSMIYLGTRLL